MTIALEIANRLGIQQLDPEIIHNGCSPAFVVEILYSSAGIPHEDRMVFAINGEDRIIIAGPKLRARFLGKGQIPVILGDIHMLKILEAVAD